MLQITHPHILLRLTVIFLSRFMLDLRGINFSERHPGDPGAESTISGPGRMSDIRFDTARIVGNLGATLSYPDFESRTSVSSGASKHPAHDGEIEEVEREGLGGGEWPWYGDEKPMYADDPFKAGLLRQPPVVVDIIELQEPLSPLSPSSPVSPVSDVPFAVFLCSFYSCGGVAVLDKRRIGARHRHPHRNCSRTSESKPSRVERVCCTGE